MPKIDNKETNMIDREQIELLIESRVAQAKVAISEGRVMFLLAVAGIFGIIIPLMMTWINYSNLNEAIREAEARSALNTSNLNEAMRQAITKSDNMLYTTSSKVDNSLNFNNAKVEKSIADVKGNFEKLAASLNRKPDLVCFHDGRPLEGARIIVSQNSNDFFIEIQNKGNGSAYYLESNLYLNCSDSMEIMSSRYMTWDPSERSEEKGYNQEFQALGALRDHLNSGRTRYLTMKFRFFGNRTLSIPAKLILSPLDSDPKEFHFTIVRNNY